MHDERADRWSWLDFGRCGRAILVECVYPVNCADELWLAKLGILNFTIVLRETTWYGAVMMAFR